MPEDILILDFDHDLRIKVSFQNTNRIRQSQCQSEDGLKKSWKMTLIISLPVNTP